MFFQSWLYISWCSSILVIKPIVSNILINSSCLNVFLNLLLHLPQTLERPNRPNVYICIYMYIYKIYIIYIIYNIYI